MKFESSGCGVVGMGAGRVGMKMRCIEGGEGTINVECHLCNLFFILPLGKSFYQLLETYFPREHVLQNF